MPDFYYIDLYFDPEGRNFGAIVDGCVNSLLSVGATFEKVMMARDDARKQVIVGEHVTIQPGDLGALAEAYLEDIEKENNYIVSFPHLGRIMFKHGFTLCQSMVDEIREEEKETRTSANDIGLSFSYSVTQQSGGRVKASLSFWEEYLLMHSTDEAHADNIGKIMDILATINQEVKPFFGAMGPELHLDTEKAYNKLWSGQMPDVNDFAIVGKSMVHMIDPDLLAASRHRTLADGAVIIQFSTKW